MTMPPGIAPSAPRGLLVVKAFDPGSDRLEMVLDGKMARVEPDQRRVRQVPQVGLSARGAEEDVALAPEDDRLGLGNPQPLLPGWVERSVGAVVVEQVELYPVRLRPGQKEQVHVPVVRADPS